MKQSSIKTERTTVVIDPALVPAVERMQAALDRVAEMEMGGDLEGVIEDGIQSVIEAFYPQALGQREQTLGEAAGDFPPPACPKCDEPVLRRGRRPKRRTARTLHGKVGFERTVWECPRCRASRAILDEELDLESHGALTGRVRKKTAWEAAKSSYAEASRNLAHQLELEVSPAECARVAQDEGRRLGRLQGERERAWAAPGDPDRPASPPEHQSRRLVYQADAGSVLTVNGEEHKMVWCATAFALEDRTSKENSQRPSIVKRRYASGAGDFESFGLPMKALANRMGARRAERTAFIADGAPCLWKWAEENMPPGTVMIQDIWHVSERLHQLARELFGAERAKSMAEPWIESLRNGKAGEVIESLRGEFRRRRGQLRKRLGEEIGYLEAGRERMDYARFEREGWPIGSGAVEGTCKHFVKARFDKPGARWRRANIAPLLALRQSIFNDEWEHDWAHPQLSPA